MKAANATPIRLDFEDYHPPRDDFLNEVLDGLSRPQKTLPSKYFYDEHGSRLFDEITHLDEYYPTRTEQAIMVQHADEIGSVLGAGTLLVEYGSGSSVKTRQLLEHTPDLAGYIPVDISKEHLLATAAELSADYPHLNITPVCADYTGVFELPIDRARVKHIVVYFPGSTIGNFTRSQAAVFLRHVAEVCGPGGGFLVGADLEKGTAILEAAYNDKKGVTADFNLNILRRINAELGADFELMHFRHRAFYNRPEGRIEMHLVSTREQEVHVGHATFRFAEGETILTEYSHKYRIEDFHALLATVGFVPRQVWTDARNLFSIHYLQIPAKGV
ncbi:L-histidine N(alpha)-methyltransferase [bacterium]|nr:L-histidine N(alpha)-methyltransferase [bacterium]